MHHAGKAARRFRNPQWRAPYVDTSPLLAPIERPTIFLVDLPRGIVRRRAYDANFVAVLHQPVGHFARILADAGRLRREIGAVNQYSHLHGPIPPKRTLEARSSPDIVN